MNSCINCGVQIPDDQNVCSMCYGDPYYGNDGLYLRELRQQAEEQQMMEELAREQFLTDIVGDEDPSHFIIN